MKKIDAGYNHVSLNSLRVFEAVVRHGSLKQAADEICVSPSAVSHQIKSLEQSLHVQLFKRAHNSITLTRQGRQFFQEIQPALASIDHAVNRLTQRSNHLVIRVGLSLAMRWLIPKLEEFKTKFPKVRVRVETTHESGFDLTPGIDIALVYRPDHVKNLDGKLILKETCQPLISPLLLQKYQHNNILEYHRIPAVSSNSTDWDWQLWEQANNLPQGSINIVDRFDTDDAAIHAAASGMGMVLSSEFMAQKELSMGSLVKLPMCKPLILGGYWLISANYPTAASRQFESWIFKMLK